MKEKMTLIRIFLTNRSCRTMGMRLSLAENKMQMKMVPWLMGWIKRTSTMSSRVCSCSTKSLREAQITNQLAWVRAHLWSLMASELEATGRPHTLKATKSWQSLFKGWAHMTFKLSALLIRATSLELIRHSSDHRIQKNQISLTHRLSN